MNIIVNGSTSFIGTNLIEELIKDKKNNIYAIVRRNSDKKNRLPSNVNIIELDMSEIEKLADLDIKCDVFFNFAWNGARGSLRLDENIQKENLTSSIKAIEVSKKLGCKKFFSAGSQAEYGNINNKVNEKQKCNPTTEYGKYKYEFYKYATKYAKENNITFIEPRFFSVYGPLDTDTTLVMTTIKKMINNEEINLSLATQKWNYLYVKDAVNALILLMKNDVESGIYNVGSLDTRRLKDFILEMKEITKSKSKLNFGKIPVKDVFDIDPDVSKLVSAVDFKEEYTFEDGIKEIVKKYRR